MDICDGSPNHSQLRAPDLLARTVNICATLAKVESELTVSAHLKPLLLANETYWAALESPTPSRMRMLLMHVNQLMPPSIKTAITLC